MTQPTQVRRPWRATLRTIFQGLVGFCVLLPFIVQASGLDPEVYPWLAGILAVAAAVARIMALPQVEAFLRRFVPFLAAAPRGEGGYIRPLPALMLALVGIALFVLLLVATTPRL